MCCSRALAALLSPFSPPFSPPPLDGTLDWVDSQNPPPLPVSPDLCVECPESGMLRQGGPTPSDMRFLLFLVQTPHPPPSRQRHRGTRGKFRPLLTDRFAKRRATKPRRRPLKAAKADRRTGR
ncbi:hypothetical protein NHX12_013153 [Muraenolepis orangiensis]|uniref:Uncharacterized protein n=1 Tax=Muraenolepis orangiensis TaxID=630683 RepID=A0A9Q0DGW3_9TELE|nr:hypothetical protein NHX12_013153 [Muraenolepis orangiensis]